MGEKTIAALCQECGVVRSQMTQWKKLLLDEGSSIVKEAGSAKTQDNQDFEKLHATIGRLKGESNLLEYVLRKSQ